MMLSGFKALPRVTVSFCSVSERQTRDVLAPDRDLSGVPTKARLVVFNAGTFGRGPHPLKEQERAFGSEHEALELTGHIEGSVTSQPLKKVFKEIIPSLTLTFCYSRGEL